MTRATCVNVIDGDTFDTDTGLRIRLARVYAPELGTPEGQVAKRRLEALILNQDITYDVVSIDVYGRSVAEVWVNGTHVNEVMRSYGYTYSQ